MAVNWEAVSAIGEIVGAIAVVVTLAYLAAQIRQSTQVARSTARQAITQTTIDAVSDLVHDRELAQAFLDDLAGKELPPADALRILGRSYVNLRNWENIHYQYMVGMLSEGEWAGFRLNLKAVMQWDSMRRFWENERHFYSPAFQAEIANITKELELEGRDDAHDYLLDMQEGESDA